MKTNILLLLLCCFAISAAQGQASFGMNFNIAKPMQEYAENLSTAPKGFSTDVVFRVKETNLSVGGEIGVSMFYNDQHLRELADEGYPGAFIEVDEEDCFLNYNAVVRYHVFKRAIVNPYIEGRLGGTSFFSTQIATEYTDLFEDKTKFHGTAFNAGIGGGVHIRFGNVPVGLDLAALANSGSFTNYRSINPEKIDTGVSLRMADGQYESKTNHLNFRIGVRFGL